jgi:hypothetical protein
MGGARQLVQDSVSLSTQRAYQVVWPRWRHFLHTLFDAPADNITPDGVYIPYALQTRQVGSLISMFAYFMLHMLALSAPRVLVLLCALRYQFHIRQGPTEAWDTPHSVALRKGLGNQPTTAVPSSRRCPVTLEMVTMVYDHYSLTPSKAAQACASAAILGFCCLLRPSEYLWGTRTDTHVLTAGQFEFEISSTDGSPAFFVPLSDVSPYPWERVTLLRITMASAKNIKRRTGSKLWFSADTHRLHVVRVMYDWAITASTSAGAPIFSWEEGGSRRQYLWYRDFHGIIKHTAQRCGFDPSHFGCHGLRVGGATLLRAAGADDGFICLMGRWKSLPACLSYQEVSTEAHDRMSRMLLSPGYYTARDLRLQYSLPKVTDM